MTTTELIAQLLQLQKEATPAPPWKHGWDYGSCDDSAELIVTLVNNLPQILQALRVQEAARKLQPELHYNAEQLSQLMTESEGSVDFSMHEILEAELLTVLQSNQEGE